MQSSSFNKFPFIDVNANEKDCFAGWERILSEMKRAVAKNNRCKTILCVECYPGVYEDDLVRIFTSGLAPDLVIRAQSLFKPEDNIRLMVQRYVTDDPVFGVLSYLHIDDFFDPERQEKAARQVNERKHGLVLMIGTGASRVADADILIYADMARWEIQQRFRRNEIGNLGRTNREQSAAEKYKQAFFVDWRVCDRLKKTLIDRWDYVLDSNDHKNPKMASGQTIRHGLRLATKRPFQLVPFFDPAPWGGQWLKKVCGLNPNTENYGWCFNCVPEENSLLLKIGGSLFELPAIDLVFYQAGELLGEAVYSRFGAEFPIRFDFLDTMDGGNLSLQVHPVTEYIQDTFGWHYTQDESYYLMDARPDAKVYLGLKEGIDPAAMIRNLKKAEKGFQPFTAEKYVQTWPAKKHDHFLIPAGTVHCSGANAMVLEISATPYIFTFKLWDWGRNGLDGKPRPVHIQHGEKVIRFDRTTGWTKKNLVNRITEIARGDGWLEERTGLHPLEFIETRRHRFHKKITHHTNGGVNVLNLVEGDEIVVESPQNRFEPFIVHYAETFVVPAAVGEYTIRPYGQSAGNECITLKAFVRTGCL